MGKTCSREFFRIAKPLLSLFYIIKFMSIECKKYFSFQG